MAEVDPVKIAIDIVDNTKDELAKIQARIKKLDSERADIGVRADVNEATFANAHAQKAALERDVSFGVRSGSGVPVPTSITDFEDTQAVDDAVRDFARGIRNARKQAGRFQTGDDALFGDMRAKERFSPGFLDSFAGRRRAVHRRLMPGVDRIPGILPDTLPVRARRTQKSIRGARNSFRNFGRTLLRYRPSIMDWWNVLALLIPVLITLAGAAVGLVAALGGVAIAAGAIVGAGLLGWGDSASESFENLKEQATLLGQELFNVLQPTANRMQPLLESAMNALPAMVGTLNDELMQLAEFGSGLGEIGRGFFEWVNEALASINSLRAEIIDVAIASGSALGSFLIEFLEFGVTQLHRNQDAVAKLGKTFVDVIAIIFDLSKAVAFTVAQLQPFFTVAAGIASLLSNKYAVAMLTFLTVMFLGGLAALEFAAALGLAEGIALSSIPVLGTLATTFAGLAGRIKGAVLALWQWNRAFAATGIGAILSIGGLLAFEAFNDMTAEPTGTRRSRRFGSSGDTNINIQGDVGRREMDRIQDAAPELFSNQQSISGGN